MTGVLFARRDLNFNPHPFPSSFFKLKPPSYTLHHTTVVQVASKRGRLGNATMMETVVSTRDCVMSVRSLVQAALNWLDWYLDSMGKLDQKTHRSTVESVRSIDSIHFFKHWL